LWRNGVTTRVDGDLVPCHHDPAKEE
jgi:hypothetical protein